MDKNNIMLSSLAMDLKRIALAYNRGSDDMALRFIQETKRWAGELDKKMLPGYINNIIINLDNLLNLKDKEKVAEDSQMFSTLLQNYSTKKGF